MVAPIAPSLWIVVVGLIIAGGGTFVLAVYTAVASDGDRTLQAFVVLLLSVFIWTVGLAGRLLVESLGGKLIWQGVMYIGVAITPVTWLVFTLLYAGHTRFVRKRIVAALSTLPAVALALLYTNGSHSLYYESVSLTYVGPTPILTTTAGELWWVWFAYAYLLVGLGIVLLVRFVLTAESLYRAQAGALIVAGLLPLTMNAIFIFDLFSNPAIDLTPLAFAMSMLLLFASVFYGRFLDLVPVARDTVVRTLEDGILVVDRDGRIVSANPAATATLTDDPDTLVGTELSTVEPTLAVTPEHAEATGGAGVARGFEASRTVDGTTEWYWVRRVDLTSATTKAGSVVTLTDITDKKRFERKLRKLQVTHQQLMVAEDRSEIVDIAVESAREVLDLPITGIWKLDKSGSCLEPMGMTESSWELFSRQPTLGPDDLAWDAIDDDELKVYTDLQEQSDVHNPQTSIRSEIHVPIGDWGIMSSGSTTQTEFDDTDFELVRLLATAVERALDRRERERRIRDLHRKTSSLMRAKSSQKIAREAVDTADDVLDLPLSGIHLTNDDGTVLEPTAVTTTVQSAFGSGPRFRHDRDGEVDRAVWEVFETGDPLIIDDLAETALSMETPVRSVIVHSLGDHGVFITSSSKSGAFTETDRALAELFATTVTAALDRVERERELRQRERDLRRQNERLDEFTSVISHDLRSPLNQMDIYLDMLTDDYDDQRLDSVADANDRAKVMIDDLLTLARQGKTVEDAVAVDVSAVAEGAWQSIPTKSTTFESDTDLGTVLADRARLRQVFQNLFRNAVEHGGSTVRVNCLEDASGVAVTDDGTGVPPDVQDTVFEHGYTTAEEGTGFGLAIVKRIVEAHGWRIHVTNTTDGGARFEITGMKMADDRSDIEED